MGNNPTVIGHPTIGPDGSVSRSGSGVFGPSVLATPSQLVTAWYIAPITGSDKNNGLTALTPIKTMAEWRRRIWNARYGSLGFPTVVTINLLESSVSLDDGLMIGFTTIGAGKVVLLATPVQIGANSTLTGVVAYAGNTRGTVTNAALPVSWAASYGLSGVGGSRYIRRVGGAGPAEALLLPLETVPKTVMIGLPTDTSEISTGTPTAGAAPFINGDTYQVVQRITWPRIVAPSAVKVQVMCVDVVGVPAIAEYQANTVYSLCGFLAAISWAGLITTYNCGFMSTVVAGDGNFVPLACSFLNTMQVNGSPNWNGQENVFLNALLQLNHAGDLCGTGLLHTFDNATIFLDLSRGGRADLSSGGIVGSGNTGKLISTISGSYVTDGALCTAVSSDPLPFQVSGSSFAAPTVDNTKGTGIYA